MKRRGRSRILLLLGLCLCGGGCVTKKLWTEDPFARIHEPATPLQLELFESKATSDVLVRYSEWTENGERQKTRAYWLNANREPKDNPHRPKFVSTPAAAELSPIPILPENAKVVPMDAPLFAVAITNPPGFQLYASERQLGAYQLPVYPDAFGKTMQVLLTPTAVVADVIIVGSVVGGVIILEGWASGAFNCW